MLHTTHKHSTVPVLALVLWFGVAMAISISKAFCTAHPSGYNLALGLLMSWLPLLIACAAVDRNPTSSRHARQALQQFLDYATAAAAVPSAADAPAVVSADCAAADGEGASTAAAAGDHESTAPAQARLCSGGGIGALTVAATETADAIG